MFGVNRKDYINDENKENDRKICENYLPNICSNKLFNSSDKHKPSNLQRFYFREETVSYMKNLIEKSLLESLIINTYFVLLVSIDIKTIKKSIIQSDVEDLDISYPNNHDKGTCIFYNFGRGILEDEKNNYPMDEKKFIKLNRFLRAR